MSIEFIESTNFTKKVIKYLNDDEVRDFQVFLILNPNSGDLIPGSGGFRVIYFYRISQEEIWLLDIYSKNEKENISTNELKTLRKEVPK